MQIYLTREQNLAFHFQNSSFMLVGIYEAKRPQANAIGSGIEKLLQNLANECVNDIKISQI